MTVRVAAIQLALGKGSYRKAIEDAIALIQRAKHEGAQIVCLPEHWLQEYGNQGYNAAKDLASIAKKDEIYLVTGANYTSVEKNGGPRAIRIRSILLSPNGQTIGEQDKVHLFHNEKNIATPGKCYRVFPTSLGNVGITVCYDNVFPETARTLTLKGADLLFVPSRIISEGLDPWILYLQARSLENRIPVIAPNVSNPPRHMGNSVIIDLETDTASRVVKPKIVASAGSNESVITADVNIDLARELRKERFIDRRPEAYSNL